ncbi:unnamed protein product, partial [Phaeothamnion confervicola]
KLTCSKHPCALVLRCLLQVAVLDGTLPRSALKRGVVHVLAKHPMLRVCIRPAGPPSRSPLEDKLRPQRWDGDGDPLRFCETESVSPDELAERVMAAADVTVCTEEFHAAWSGRLEAAMDHTQFDIAEGPNWQLGVVRDADRPRMALIFSMNHALEDQKSANLMLNDLLASAA